MPNLTNSSVAPSATLNIIILNLNSSKNDILTVGAQLLALKRYENCEHSMLKNQIESFTEHTKMSLGPENRNVDVLYKIIVFLQKRITKTKQLNPR